ncbi:UNVERIFIED_CONTAM: hypothetical protein Scaly_2265500 [Sesamum calycinum]|uniref:Retrotransposon gag protein n=1 Tax=Sesamum calycinum TaxID=2727403 RepID=A0AAW2MC60_9LAMI
MSSESEEEEVMAQNPEQTINEMTSLDLNQQPLFIEYPTLDVDFELKSGLIHLLLTFRGLAGFSEVNRSLVDVASEDAQPNQVDNDIPKVFVPKPPFPERFAKSKNEKEILETLRKVEVNISLLDAIKQVPRYAKFLKKLYTNESKLRGNERVKLGENVSSIIQRKLPPKCKDPSTFSILCKIGKIGIEKATCDLGASINVMPLAIYESLNVGRFKNMGVVLQLADRSIVYPEGVLENVLVQVNELVFPADFYVLDMTGDNSPNSISILLGRPFRETSKTKIDVGAGTLFMEFNNEFVSFSIGGVTQNSNDMHYVVFMDFIDPLVQGNATFDGGEHPR